MVEGVRNGGLRGLICCDCPIDRIASPSDDMSYCANEHTPSACTASLGTPRLPRPRFLFIVKTHFRVHVSRTRSEVQGVLGSDPDSGAFPGSRTLKVRENEKEALADWDGPFVSSDGLLEPSSEGCCQLLSSRCGRRFDRSDRQLIPPPSRVLGSSKRVVSPAHLHSTTACVVLLTCAVV